MTAHVYLNGRIISEEQAQVSVYDGGWLHGAGLFETMRAENGRVFRLDAHLARLMHSAAELLHPIERADLPSAGVFQELLSANGLREARVRLTVTAGSLRAGTEVENQPLTVCATISELFSYPQKLFDEGITVVASRFLQSSRDPLAGHKTTCYLPRLLALREAQRSRCIEALWFTTEHLLAEGSISNVFLVKNQSLRTPALETPVLPGIARADVLQLARGQGMTAEETRLTINDLLDADEVFLTNAIMQIMPVVRVEKHDFSEGRPGPITRRLRNEYRELVSKECGG